MRNCARKYQGTISNLFPPIAEQMENKEQGCRLWPRRRFTRKVGFNFIEEQREHFSALGRSSFQSLSRETLGVSEFTQNCFGIHRSWLCRVFASYGANPTLDRARLNLEFAA